MPTDTPKLVVAVAAKPWWMSRTLWLNALVLVLAYAESQLHVLQPLMPVNVYAVLTFGLPLVNMALRAVTTSGLTGSSNNSGPAQ